MKIKLIVIVVLNLFIIGCAMTQDDTHLYNTLQNYEIVFVDSKITKTSELALKQINSDDSILNVKIFLYRQDKSDIKSILLANEKKVIISSFLRNKSVNFIYDPKIDNKNGLLKVEY
jgi:hypothetical protein